ncbi:MAG: tetratricopeptide repeat protein [Proteobacteria bacterium]|nr:tetratricopeptide repeat protein [Pseudomonadota bacterium]
MPVRSVILSVLVVLWLWPTVTYGQATELDAAYKRYGDLNSQGRYQDALPFARKALKLAEKKFGPDHPTTGIFLNNVGVLYYNQGMYVEAGPLLKRALSIDEKILGPEHPDSEPLGW